MPQQQILEVWGELACFSRPEMKVERFSYPVITPSAARGIFDAIYCKPPAFRWQIRKIEVLSLPSYIALRRNEVKDKVSVSAVGKWMNGKAEPEPIIADGSSDMLGTDMKGRTQRQTMALKDVRYRLHAEIRPWPGAGGNANGFESQFRRRASQGKCFCQPCFGCREFPAYFALADDIEEVRSPVKYDAQLGFMLYDVFDLSRPGDENDPPFITLFRAEVRDGILEVPDFDSAQVLKPERSESRC